jgi:hypothetical protein
VLTDCNLVIDRGIVKRLELALEVRQ